MSLIRLVAPVIIGTTLLFRPFATARAVTIPTFPSCAAPQGNVKVSYSSGVHGIVGSEGTYTGRDTVYTLSEEAVTQCFCPENGKGIQTDWWKADALSDNDLKVLKSQGWIFVPAGELWGLNKGPYVARNTTLSCLPQASTSSASTTSTTDSGDGGGGDQGGLVEGDVLGLASTGDILLVYAAFASGILCLLTGIRRLRQ